MLCVLCHHLLCLLCHHLLCLLCHHLPPRLRLLPKPCEDSRW